MKKINKCCVHNVVALADGGGSGGSNITSAYTTTIADVEKLDILIEALKAKYTAIDTNVKNLYTMIDNMPNEGAWDGTVYKDFKDKAYSYKDGLDGFVLMIDAYANILKKINEYVNTTLDSAIKSHSGGGK